MDAASLKQEMSAELQRILQFWLEETVDREHGGFYGRIENDLTVRRQAPKGLVLCARILWTFSRAYRTNPQQPYLETAQRALAYLERFFRDPVYPGYFWMVDYRGNPLETKKQLYGQAFHLYAVTEYVMATGQKELLPLASQLFGIVEKGYDSQYGGYLEAFARDWTEEKNLRLGERDQNDKKSMNTHLHILEAYTNLYRIWPDPRLREALRRLVHTTLTRIINRRSGHFILFFDEDWTPKSPMVSYGHDIEGSWLLMEAAYVLDDEALVTECGRIALQMVDAVCREGVDADGGVMWEGNAQGAVDTDKHWWGQAEAIVGFINAWQMSGEQRYWEMAVSNWRFVKTRILDPVHGEWFWRTTKTGRPVLTEPKVSEWKCPYHNSRACFEVLERL